MSGDNQDSVPIARSGFSVSIKQWNSLNSFTIDWMEMLMFFLKIYLDFFIQISITR